MIKLLGALVFVASLSFLGAPAAMAGDAAVTTGTAKKDDDKDGKGRHHKKHHKKHHHKRHHKHEEKKENEKSESDKK